MENMQCREATSSCHSWPKRRSREGQKKFAEIPIINSVIRRIDSLGKKEQFKNGLSFKNRKGEEYIFDNEDEYEMIVKTRTPTPFPDIATEAPGILTKQEELLGVSEVIQSEPKPTKEQRVMLAAANSGIDFSLPPEYWTNRGEIIEILDDEDNDILDKYMKEENTRQLCEETLPKIEEDQEDEETPEEVVEHNKEYWQSNQNRIANKQNQDYKLYVTVEEEDKLDIEEDPEKDPEKIVSMAHYIMMLYAEKESLKKRRRKKYKPKAGQYSL
jgi:hypothetical protein